MNLRKARTRLASSLRGTISTPGLEHWPQWASASGMKRNAIRALPRLEQFASATLQNHSPLHLHRTAWQAAGYGGAWNVLTTGVLQRPSLLPRLQTRDGRGSRAALSRCSQRAFEEVLMSRLACGIAAIAALLPGFAYAGDPDPDVQVQVVDAMNKVFGVHPGFRAFHSKGIVVTGKFIGTSEGAELSKAELFAGNTIPVTVRFSDNGG